MTKYIEVKEIQNEHKEAALNLLNSTVAILKFNSEATKMAEAVLNKYPKHKEQIAALAPVVDTSIINLTMANISYDLLFGMIGCSTMALATPDGPMIARNMDWFPADLIAKASVITPTDNGFNAGFIGMAGVITGLSNNGFGLALNAVYAGKPEVDGYPILLFLRKVLDEAADYNEARTMIENEPLMSGGLITLVGKENHQRCIIERSHKTFKTREANENEPLIATNHYRELVEPAECSRYDYLQANIGKKPPLELLTSEEVIQTITSQHVVVKPNEGTMNLYIPDHLFNSQNNLDFMDVISEIMGTINTPPPTA